MNATPRLLVVGHDAERRMAWTAALQMAGFDVVETESGRVAMSLARQWTPQGVVCGWPLQEPHNGLDLLRFLRESDERMLIVVVGANDPPSIREVLNAGADVCLPADYDRESLVAQVDSVLDRRSSIPRSKIRCGDLLIDIAGHQAWRGEGKLSLTSVEFRLLVSLARHCGEVVSKPMLLDEVWRRHDDDGLAGGHLVDVTVGSLRKKLHACGPQIVHTVRSQGFILRP